MPHQPGHPISAEMEQCIENCTECHNICEQTLAYCLQMGGKHAEVSHIQSLIDCAETCAASANFMLRRSPLHPQVCGVCSQACALCAESCEQFGDDEQMQACAQVCRRCEESCRQMSRMQMAM